MIATTYHQETCRRHQRLLDEWQGGYARIWEFSPSHDTLTIRVTCGNRQGNLHVICSPCVSVTGPIHWENCKLELRCQSDQNGETIFMLRDQAVPIEVACRNLSTAENVEPLY